MVLTHKRTNSATVWHRDHPENPAIRYNQLYNTECTFDRFIRM